jgi:hypothetical protein
MAAPPGSLPARTLSCNTLVPTTISHGRPQLLPWTHNPNAGRPVLSLPVDEHDASLHLPLHAGAVLSCSSSCSLMVAREFPMLPAAQGLHQPWPPTSSSMDDDFLSCSKKPWRPFSSCFPWKTQASTPPHGCVSRRVSYNRSSSSGYGMTSMSCPWHAR